MLFRQCSLSSNSFLESESRHLLGRIFGWSMDMMDEWRAHLYSIHEPSVYEDSWLSYLVLPRLLDLCLFRGVEGY